MSVAVVVSELEKLLATKNAIRAALLASGADVPEGAPFDAYPAIIIALAGGTVVPVLQVTVNGTVNTVAAPTIGDTVTITAAEFGPTPDNIAFLFQRRIPGQAWQTVAHDFTGGAYTFVADDMGREFTGLWTATRAGYTPLTYRSVAVAPLALVFTGDPELTLRPRVGDAIGVTLPIYPVEEATIAYQWRLNGANITDETGATYTCVLADRGKVLSVLITATLGAQEIEYEAFGPAVVHAAPVVVEEPAAVTLTQAEGETALVGISNVFDGVGLTYRLIEQSIEDGDEIEFTEGNYVEDGYVADGYAAVGDATIGPPAVEINLITGALTIYLDLIRSGKITIECVNEGGSAKVDMLISVVADAGEPAAAPPALEVGDWTITAEMATPTTARAKVVISGENPADVQWTKVGTDPVDGDWKFMVPNNGSFLTYCEDGTCFEAVGTTDAYYLRYRNNPTGLWSAISDGKTFVVTAATVTAASGTFSYDLYRGMVNSMNLRQLFVADFPIEITITDEDMPEPFEIDAAGQASVTVMPEEALGARTVTVTGEFVGGDAGVVPMEPLFIGETYSSGSTVTLPVDMLAGDTVLIAARGPDTMTVPAEWTTVYDQIETFAGVDARLVYAWQTADSPVMGSGTWTGAARLLAGVYRNLDADAPFGTPVNGSTASAAVVTYPAVTGLVDPAWIACLQYTQANVEPAAHPGMVIRRSGPAGSGFNRLRLMDTDGAVASLAQTTGTAGASVSAVRLTMLPLNALFGDAPASEPVVADWFVATDGSDMNAGTSQASPFATWQAAFDAAAAGDVIAIRGGTYTLPSSYTWAQSTFAIVDAPTNGTSEARITVKSYDGRAVLDFSEVPSSAYAYGFMPDGDYWTFEDLDFTGIQQDDAGHFMLAVGTEHPAVGQQWNRCRAYANAGPAFYFYQTQDVVFTDCDAYANRDTLSGGGNADGFAFVDAGTGNKWIRCRSWNNSDDGFDCWDTDNRVEIEHCWAWSNGYAADGSTAAGDGNGFKLGQNIAGTRHLLTRCIAAQNRLRGFDNNGSLGVNTLRHCAAYASSGRHSLGDYVFDTAAAAVLQNCLSFSGDVDLHANVTATTCSWDEATVSVGDFESVDASQLGGARASNGALPTITFLVPVDGSDLVDVGTDIGLAFNQVAPDIGWFETTYVAGTPAVTWSFVAKTTGAVASGNITPTEPTGAADGDLLVASIAYRGNAAFTVPSGWTAITSQNTGNVDTNVSTAIASTMLAYTVRGASAPSYAFTRTGGDVATASVLAYRASAGTLSVDVSGSQTAASATTTPAFPSLTTTAPDTLIVAQLAGADNLSAAARIQSSGGVASGALSATSEQAGTDTSTITWQLRTSLNSTAGADTYNGVWDLVQVDAGLIGTITPNALSESARHATALVAFKSTVA